MLAAFGYCLVVCKFGWFTLVVWFVYLHLVCWFYFWWFVCVVSVRFLYLVFNVVFVIYLWLRWVGLDCECCGGNTGLVLRWFCGLVACCNVVLRVAFGCCFMVGALLVAMI